MTITQLEYIVALDDLKSFSKAADFCCVTQPSLSMQIQKLESELNIIIFNRKDKPLKATLQGEEIIRQARVILKETATLKDLSKGWSNQVAGNVSIGVIPTIAPYLMPRFLSGFQLKFPDLHINISETTTSNIVKEIKEGKLDIGILVTPLGDQLIEKHLYYEELYLYSNLQSESGEICQYVEPEKLWLLEEGHCLSSQINSICNLKSGQTLSPRITYQTGSLETIVRIAEDAGGQTIIPEMLYDFLDDNKQEHVFPLPFPKPVREVSLVYSPSYARKGIIQALHQEILSVVPESWRELNERNIIPI
ncbi:LysR substrate-binding domain-containing protein [Aquirufa sp. OSTEICH-129A]